MRFVVSTYMNVEAENEDEALRKVLDMPEAYDWHVYEGVLMSARCGTKKYGKDYGCELPAGHAGPHSAYLAGHVISWRSEPVPAPSAERNEPS